MLFLSSLLLLAISSTQAHQQQLTFSAPPPSSYHPTHIFQQLEVGGSLVRSTTVYTLVQDERAQSKEWVVGLKGQEGFVEAWVGKSGVGKKAVGVEKLGRNDNNVTFYSLSLPSSGNTAVSIHSVTSHITTPRPRVLSQTADSVAMLWNEDILDLVAGLSEADKKRVEEVKVKVKTPTPRILEKAAPEAFELAHSQGGATVTFTSKAGTKFAELNSQVALVHYQQIEPVMSIRKLDRLVEVSHWGNNLAFVDAIDLINTGPELKGYFSRLDHQKAAMQRRTTAHAIKSLSLTLPPRIHSPYYIDIVGNVSTSRFRPSASPKVGGLPSQKKSGKNSLLELVPRYPLMGGWNYTFTIGYDAVLEDFVKRRNGDFVLAVPFLTEIKEVAIDDVTLSIRLPEGATNIRVHTPFPVDSLTYPTTTPSFLSLFSRAHSGYTKTYLDSTGRPTVVMNKLNCGDRNGGQVLIEYSIPTYLDLLQKPLVAATALAIMFLSIIFLRRLETSIGK